MGKFSFVLRNSAALVGFAIKMCPILPKVAGSNENVCTFHDFLTSNTNTIKNANIKVVQLSDCCSLSNESDFTSKNKTNSIDSVQKTLIN